MALNKKNEFNSIEIELAEMAKSLSHPARIAILKLLAEKDMCICGELVADLPLAQSTVSQHLKELKNAGLIKGTIDGPKSCYCIDWKKFELFLKQFNSFAKKMTECKANNCC